MPPANRRRPRRCRRHYHPLFLLITPTIIFLNTGGSAFIPLPTHAASSDMSTDQSKPRVTGSGTSKPLSAEEGGTDSNTNDSSEEILQLPEASNDPSIPSIKLGDSISFEEMGPVIINADGSTRRIDNWDTMTKKEQEVAWRRISKRNEERRKALLEQQQKETEAKKEG